MVTEEAFNLAKRIINCWHGGPTINEWRDYLLGLDDHQRAVSVFERFRGRMEHPPSIARFADEYRALAHTTPRAHSEHQPPPKLTREQVQAILIANGAPERYVRKP